MVEAPVFHPTEKEFQDPLEYIDRIRPVAEKFGLCRVVPPPNFKVGVHQLNELSVLSGQGTPLSLASRYITPLLRC
jgi:hypothetical protein